MRFGDGVRGMIPPKGDRNVRAVSYRVLEDSVEVTTTAAVWHSERPTDVIENFISLIEPPQH